MPAKKTIKVNKKKIIRKKSTKSRSVLSKKKIVKKIKIKKPIKKSEKTIKKIKVAKKNIKKLTPAKKKIVKKTAYKIILSNTNQSSITPDTIRPTLEKIEYIEICKRASSHVLDLKKLNFESEQKKHQEKDYTKNLQSKLNEKIPLGQISIKKISNKAYFTLPTKKKKFQTSSFDYQYPKDTTVIALEGHQLIQESINKQKSKKHRRTIKIKLPKINPKYLRIELSIYAQKAIASFVIASFVLTSPLMAFDYYHNLQQTKGTVLGVTYEALDHIKTSMKTTEYKDLLSTQYELTKANENFKKAQSELTNINPFIALIAKALPFNEYESAQQLLNVGEKITNISSDVLEVINNKNGGNLSDSLVDLIDLLLKNKENLKDIINSLSLINTNIIPEKYQSQFIQISNNLTTVQNNFDLLLNNSEYLLNILGKNSPKRYLILFQNNNELRPTGGFIGSYAELNLDHGKITNISVPKGGIYDISSQLDQIIEPPKAISLINNKWEIQDANYFPDLEKSAKIIQNFYEHSGGTTTDGIITLNATFISELLKVTGQIELTNYNEIVTSENFIEKAQNYAESSDDKLNNVPKKFIASLTPKLLDKILNLDNVSLLELMKTITFGLNNKEIQAYFNDSKLQSFAKDNNFTGNIANTAGDYLNIVSTNLSGSKNNLKIEDHVGVQVDINNNGYVEHTITLVRENSSLKTNYLENKDNIDYIRFYVPLGAELVSATGFEPIADEKFLKSKFSNLTYNNELVIENSIKKIDSNSKTEVYQDSGKTVFANWIITKAGESQAVTIKYRTKNNNITQKKKLDWQKFILKEFNLIKSQYNSYSLLIQKQSGKLNQNYNVIINTPEKNSYIWAYPSQLNIDNNQFSLVNYKLNKDLFIALVLDEK